MISNPIRLVSLGGNFIPSIRGPSLRYSMIDIIFYDNIIPKVFNNENIEFLDDSLYNFKIFDELEKLNNSFVKFMLKSEKGNEDFSEMLEIESMINPKSINAFDKE